MKKTLTPEESKLFRKYHYPHCGNFCSVKVGAIFISKANTKEHEDKKEDVCWDLLHQDHKYLTEAERAATDEEVKIFKLKSKKKIIDVVDLTAEDEFEIIHKNEGHKEVLFYRSKGVIPVIVNPFICKVCKLKYPIKLKRHEKDKICDICLKGD